MATPDVLHCHHTDQTRALLSRFPDRPGVYVQHDAEARIDVPPDHPRLLRYLAVDMVCRERLLARGIASPTSGSSTTRWTWTGSAGAGRCPTDPGVP